MTSSPRDLTVYATACPSKQAAKMRFPRPLQQDILKQKEYFVHATREGPPMEAHWIADRAALRCLARQHPDWTQEELAACIGRSRSFVKKWLKRFRGYSH